MKQIEMLGESVERAWKTAGNEVKDFTAIATRALEDLKETSTLNHIEEWVTGWMLKNPVLPKQISVANNFGQPSVTIFNNGRFVVDLYFWVDFDTSIHSHGFRGAFRVLHGQSLHETFRTPEIKKFADDVRLVDMSQVEREILKVGDIRTIAPGLDLTHRVVHLENPTITLCIRTVNEEALKQWTYLSTGLSIRKEEVTADLAKKIYYFQYLLGQKGESALHFLRVLLDSHSLSQQIHLYEEVASELFGLRSEVAQIVVEEIVAKHEASEWWKLYENAHVARMNELSFEHCQTAVERLVGHFINSGLTYHVPLLGLTEGEARRYADALLSSNDPENETQIGLVHKFLT